MRADIWNRAILALACVVLSGVAAGPALVQAQERHGKTIKQCNDELKANAAALAKAREGSAEFIHACWWQTAAGQPTPIRGLKTVAALASPASGTGPVARTQPDAEMAAKAKQEIAKAQEQTARAREQAAKAREQAAEAEADAAKTRKTMMVAAAKADAAAKAEKAARVAAEAEAKASAEAVAKMKAAADAAAAETEAKAKADAERVAALETAQAARVRAAADALQKVKAEQAVRVEAAAAALAAAKAQQVQSRSGATRQAEVAPAEPRREPRLRREARRARPELVRPAPPAREAQRVVRAPRLFLPRRVVVDRPDLVPHPARRTAAADPAGSRPVAASPSGMVMVPVHIPGLGLERPVPWPVLPAYVPAFRAVVNHPIVPGFTSTP